MWADLLKVRDIYLQGRKFVVGNGKKILFWKDRWAHDQPFAELFPDLFKMAQKHNISLAEVKNDPNSVHFSRWLVGIWKKQWDSIVYDISMTQLNNSDDYVIWKFGTKGTFTVKSVYNALTANESGPSHRKIWKSKIPAKIQIFLWLVLNNAILTKDNLIKRKWVGDPSCYFCHMDESVSHLFFHCNLAQAVWATFATCIGASDIPKSLIQCWAWCEKWIPGGKKFHTLGIAAICWSIWKAQNKLCFEGKVVLNPLLIICHACALMTYWAGLYLAEDKETLEGGVNMMLEIAMKLLNKKARPSTVLAIQDDSEGNQQD